MEIQCVDQQFLEELAKLADLRTRKTLDYASAEDPNENLRSVERIKLRCLCGELVAIPAWIGVHMRRTDKFARELNLISKDPAVVDESFEDSLRDDVVYGLIELILYREWKTRR